MKKIIKSLEGFSFIIAVLNIILSYCIPTHKMEFLFVSGGFAIYGLIILIVFRITKFDSSL